MSYQQSQDWGARYPGQPIPVRFIEAIGWTLIISAGIWLTLWTLSSMENTTLSASGHGDWCRFDALERQRIFEGRPISRKLLWIHALFGLVGFALGAALALKVAATAAWQWQERYPAGRGLAGLAVVVIVLTVIAGRRIR